jgi:hypothetical protein
MSITINGYGKDSLARYMGTQLTNGFLEIQDSANTVLMKMHLPVTAWQDANNSSTGQGQKLAGVWFGTVHAPGNADHFVMYDANNKWQVTGTISNTSANTGDLIIDNTVLVLGKIININTCNLKL